MRRKITYIVNVDWFFISHRLPLALAAREAGEEVLILTCDTGKIQSLRDQGLRAEHIPLDRALSNPLAEFLNLLRLRRRLQREKPDVVHCVALKAVVLGGLAARLSGVPRIVLAVTGLGSTFLGRSLKSRVWQWLMRQLLAWICAAPAVHVIVQNADDREGFGKQGLVPEERLHLIRGSGVDTSRWTPGPEPDIAAAGFRVVLPARLLRDKGLGEFVAAARILQGRGLDKVRMILVGAEDLHNRSAITHAEVTAWVREGVVEWAGPREDMREVYHGAHLVVLPSYREGLPKVLIEAGACARACVATDVPGCREIIRNSVNGLLIPPQQAEALADAIETLYRNPGLRRQLGEAAREIVVREYDLRLVIDATRAVYGA
ncbi:MAG: glycosyltransferase family 4 protein [Verrucomicrobiae bacterium]|nr:glycosyltransferase family 4 protein [Verrucomicrobiae bacterium]